MATNDSNVRVFRSKVFTTEAVIAVFPHLNEVNKFGGYEISVDVLENTDFQKLIESQAKETLANAHKSLDTKKMPTNLIVKDGEYKGDKWCRIAFKMSGTHKVEGNTLEQAPKLVGADRQPLSETIWGGSRVKISYLIQYTLMPTGTFLSLKLKGVQVLTLVGPNGEVTVEEMFDVEEGYSSTPPLPEEAITVTAFDSSAAAVQSGSDF